MAEEMPSEFMKTSSREWIQVKNISVAFPQPCLELGVVEQLGLTDIWLLSS